MTQQMIIKIGNSAGIILPKNIREESNLQVGDNVTLNQIRGKIVLVKTSRKKQPPITAKFAHMVDEFMTDHKDILRELANK